MSYDTMPERATLKAIYLAEALRIMSGGKGTITMEHADTYKITLALAGEKSVTAEGKSLFSAVKKLAQETNYCPLKGD